MVALAAVAGCTATPKAGPDDKAIYAQALVTQKADETKPLLDYAVVDITPSILKYFDDPEPIGFASSFGVGSGAAPDLRIGVGDVLEITIFEKEAGGLFVPAQAGSRPGNFITLPRQTVDTAGTISVPYAGRIRVSGRAPSDVQAEIERTLASRALEPQAVVTIAESRSNEVSVLGDVNSAAKLSVNPNGERLLDVISRAGGINAPVPESTVTLQRRGRTATIAFSRLLANPRENVFVFPGDVVFVNRDRRTYTVFGAMGQNGRVNFEESDLTLAEALGKAGGLLDERADPATVFLYRRVASETAAALGLPASVKDTGTFPVIFRANLRNPAMFFLTQRFRMRDQDILYIDNAETVELLKVIQVFNAATDTVLGGAADVRTVTRN